MSTHTHTHIVCRIPINLSPLYFYLELRLYCVQCAQLFATPRTVAHQGSSAHGIFQARILDWVAIFLSRGSSLPRDQTSVLSIFCIGMRLLYHCTTWEAFTFTYLLLCIHILLCALADLSACQNSILFVLIPFVYVVRLSKIA